MRRTREIDSSSYRAAARGRRECLLYTLKLFRLTKGTLSRCDGLTTLSSVRLGCSQQSEPQRIAYLPTALRDGSKSARLSLSLGTLPITTCWQVGSNTEGMQMKKVILIAGLLAFSTAAFAQSGTSSTTSPAAGAKGSSGVSNGPGGPANAGAVGGGSAGAGSSSAVGGATGGGIGATGGAGAGGASGGASGGSSGAGGSGSGGGGSGGGGGGGG